VHIRFSHPFRSPHTLLEPLEVNYHLCDDWRIIQSSSIILNNTIKTISRLQEVIKQSNNVLRQVCLYHCDETIQWKDNQDDLRTQISRLIKSKKALNDNQNIGTLEPRISAKDTLLVKIPGAYVFSLSMILLA
jgi:hypothetical protein